MTNTSATGGPLLPNPPAPPLEGQALNRFLQQWLVGISGLAGQMFRPRWQAEPVDIPDAGEAWAAFGISKRTADVYPYEIHFSNPTDGMGDQLQRHETLEMLISFYDLGTNGLADFYASQLRDGLAIAQNQEPLTAAGFAFISCGDMMPVPSLLKTRWLYRVDLPVTVRRAIARIYPILDVEEGIIKIIEQDPAGNNTIINLDVTENTP